MMPTYVSKTILNTQLSKQNDQPKYVLMETYFTCANTDAYGRINGFCLYVIVV